MASKKYNIKGSKNQDLIAARQELKQFRHDVAILKKKGILDKSIYDARSVKPSKYLKSQIKKFADVISGAAKPVKVSKSSQKFYKEQGYKIKNGRVVVPVQSNEKVYSVRGDFRVKAIGRGGSITKINLQFDRSKITTWADQLRNYHIKLNKDEILTFQFFGHNSHRAFENLHGKTAAEAMAEYIENYPAFEQTKDLDPDKQQDFIDNVTIFKIKRDENGRINRPEIHGRAKERDTERERRNAERRRAARERRFNNMSEAQELRVREEAAKRSKEYRGKLSEEQYKKQLEAGRERAKKSREKRKQGK